MFFKILVMVVLLGSLSLAACDGMGGGQKLRIVNASPNAITNLRVMFPEQEIAFGDVAGNETTGYKVFPKGVYRYAAYKYDWNGETVTQPVIDWVGEMPMEGREFTYTISFEPNHPQMLRVQLADVSRDP